MLQVRIQNVLMGALLGALVLPLSFKASADERVYYSHEDVVRCQDTAASATAGAIVGGMFGFILGHGHAAPTVIGAAAGGLMGAGLSCHDQQIYVQRIDDRLSAHDYDHAYEDDHLRISVLKSGYDLEGHVCRTYHTDFFKDGYWDGYDQTACYVNGLWMHGYDDVRIVNIHYHRDPVIIVHTEPNYYYGHEHIVVEHVVAPRPFYHEDFVAHIHDDHHDDHFVDHHEDRHDDHHDDHHDDRHHDLVVH